ncbi:nuclear transport factor 2 family protein [Cytophaga aurantiaca]|uniref:nuclear transport factor 2 family protein n=1 Tax=Cytophaga aurantiaca TaxID=29530 RepID=UPI000363D494|nr:nuclear transport factor 2 family protein [Cytophaga aurantiaca]
MEATNRLVSQKFSNGAFAAVYTYFCDDIEWNIIGNQVLKGKADIIHFCDKMLTEMESSELTNNNIIETNEQIVIEGKCRYFDAEGKDAFVNYCDIYLFENDKIKTITSYCI